MHTLTRAASRLSVPTRAVPNVCRGASLYPSYSTDAAPLEATTSTQRVNHHTEDKPTTSSSHVSSTPDASPSEPLPQSKFAQTLKEMVKRGKTIKQERSENAPNTPPVTLPSTSDLLQELASQFSMGTTQKPKKKKKKKAHKSDVSKANASKDDASKVNVSKVNASKVNASKVNASKVNASKGNASKADTTPEHEGKGKPRRKNSSQEYEDSATRKRRREESDLQNIPRLNEIMVGIIESEAGWTKEQWKDDWGTDKLQPHGSTESSTISKKVPHEEKLPPPHLVRFSKRIEGLIELNDEPTLVDVPPVDEHQPIATLTHGIDRVLFNPGVHWLQDPRSRVYNFTPWLEKIPRVSDFAFESLDGFTSSSRDKELWELARREKKSYAGSTSSLSGMLSQIYFLISGDKEVDTSTLSAAFRKEPKSFTPGQRMPSSVKLNYRDGRYAIDSYSISGSSEKNVLTWMGTLLEKFITMTREEFSTYMRTSDTPPPPKDPRREAFRFAKSKRFVMRSQLDCQDPRLPGTGVFDIKTRACVPIRMDILNFEENSGYLIKHQYGLLESFEKEYYDLIRSAFLKYSFQVRIGNMDGVIVAYHNTARMFGFQYIPLTEMEERLYGPGEGVGDRVFDKCVGMLENVMDEIVKCFPEQTVQCTFETQERSRKLNIWVEPEQWEGAAEDRPIKQLEVTVTNYLGQEPVTGNEAVSSTTKPWTIHYTITHLIDDEFAVRKRLLGCQERQFRAYAIPAGVALDDLPKFWDTLNFGPPSTEESKESDFDPKFFREPSASINKMRALAQQGRKETLRLYELDSKKPKIVFGGEDIPPDAPLVQEVSLEASRDVEDNVGTFLGAVGDSIALSKIGHDSSKLERNSLSDMVTKDSEMFNAALASCSEELSTTVDAKASSAPGVPSQRSTTEESNVATEKEDTLSSGGKSASPS